MTRVIFENATIRDVIGKASRIAPTKGSAFDRAAGIIIKVDADAGHAIVKATNTEVFYMEIVDVVAIDGESKTWRLGSALLDGICNKIPIGSGATITLDDSTPNEIAIATGRMRAKLRSMDASYFPKWDAFDPAGLTSVPDFGARLQQVQWAASKANLPPMTGINLNGEVAGATDKFRLAITPCVIPSLAEPITIPANTFAPMMKTLGDVKIGQEQGMILVMPDDTTQIKAVIYAEKYPAIASMFQRQETNAVLIKKDPLIEMIEQAMVIGARDRNPLLKLIIGQEELAVMMEDEEMGLLGNVIDITGQCTHDRHYIGMNPDNILNALRASPNPDVTMYYFFGMSKKPVRLDGGSGYEVLLMPRALEVAPSE